MTRHRGSSQMFNLAIKLLKYEIDGRRQDLQWYQAKKKPEMFDTEAIEKLKEEINELNEAVRILENASEE